MGAKFIVSFDRDFSLGLGIHEMGTARMGGSPEDSVLNKWNQVWGPPNVLCTDGAAMVTAGCQNPSLTDMALTARAAARTRCNPLRHWLSPRPASALQGGCRTGHDPSL